MYFPFPPAAAAAIFVKVNIKSEFSPQVAGTVFMAERRLPSAE